MGPGMFYIDLCHILCVLTKSIAVYSYKTNTRRINSAPVWSINRFRDKADK